MNASQPNSAVGVDVARLEPQQVRAWAQETGFAEAGLVPLPHAQEDRDAARFEEWIEAGRAGTMNYLKRTEWEPAERGTQVEGVRLLRARPTTPYPWARSAIVCFTSYHSAQPRSTDRAKAGAGWIARYAWSSRKQADGVRRPSDYHKVLKKRLALLESRLHDQYGGFEARGCVDTGPVVERALATAAGLGWTGKNTCLIHPKLGSYGFLAVLLTSLPVDSGLVPAAMPDRCGTCTRCLDACPTGALIAPYQMDAARCISYLTIELKGPIEDGLMEATGRQVFGCDICQDVCPWNRKAPVAADANLEAREELVNPSLDWLAELDEAAFERVFNGSPVRRAGFQGLRRNVAVAMGNSCLARFAPALSRWSEAADDGLRAAARWALSRLQVNAQPDATEPPEREQAQPDSRSAPQGSA